MSFDIEIEDQIRKDMNIIVHQGIVNGIYKACNLVHVNAVKNCPMGAYVQLKNSIEMDVDEDKEEGTVGTNIEYAIYVEYGTKKHFPPVDALKEWAKKKLGNENLAFAVAQSIARKGTRAQPFLRTAFYDNQDKIIQFIQQEVEKKVGR
jgi:HK97 gp10 family phage protein